ncbi:MAG: arsenite methyltransferase [Acidobacteriota bacterium]|nr:arsenite methyltransferase [Acidobacteriota bacterium]
MAELKRSDIQELVRERYAAAALQVTGPQSGTGCASSEIPDGGGCCGSGETAASGGCCGSGAPASGDLLAADEVFGAQLYATGERKQLPDAALLASLGCGNPTAVAALHEGETVLDLGSGGGIDVLLSAGRVGPTGLVYGLDMTDEMLALARANQRQAGVQNVRWLRGQIEQIPLPAEAVDVVISNCVINLSGDKPRVIAEAARVLRPGGRFAVTDVIADEDMDEATRADMRAFTGCIAGALTRREFEEMLGQAGFEDIEIEQTHRVHRAAASAIVRARKPAAA